MNADFDGNVVVSCSLGAITSADTSKCVQKCLTTLKLSLVLGGQTTEATPAEHLASSACGRSVAVVSMSVSVFVYTCIVANTYSGARKEVILGIQRGPWMRGSPRVRIIAVALHRELRDSGQAPAHEEVRRRVLPFQS